MRPIASRTSWQGLPPPEQRAALDYHPSFDHQEAQQLLAGLIPRSMEEKWFIFFDSDWLYFHRSWTGYCIFWMRLTGSPTGVQTVETWVNRDPDQYGSMNDSDEDIETLDYLIRDWLRRGV